MRTSGTLYNIDYIQYTLASELIGLRLAIGEMLQ